MTGSTGSRQRVKPKEIAHMNIAIPPSSQLVRYNEISSPIHQRSLLNIRESQTLAQIRDTLLPKLISGEIRLPEAEKIVEDVV